MLGRSPQDARATPASSIYRQAVFAGSQTANDVCFLCLPRFGRNQGRFCQLLRDRHDTITIAHDEIACRDGHVTDHDRRGDLALSIMPLASAANAQAAAEDGKAKGLRLVSVPHGAIDDQSCDAFRYGSDRQDLAPVTVLVGAATAQTNTSPGCAASSAR